MSVPFLKLCNAVQICPCCAKARGQSWNWIVGYPISVLKWVTCFLASDPCMHSSGVRPGTIGLLSECISSLWSLWYFPVLWRSPFWFSGQKPGLQLPYSAVFFSWLPASTAQRQENRERGNKSTGVCPTLLGLLKVKNHGIVWYGFNACRCHT